MKVGFLCSRVLSKEGLTYLQYEKLYVIWSAVHHAHRPIADASLASYSSKLRLPGINRKIQNGGNNTKEMLKVQDKRNR